jgi:hypothetical protein
MCGKNDGITVYVSKDTSLKEVATKIKLNQHFYFLALSRNIPIDPRKFSLE